jgi:hypothetical protein
MASIRPAPADIRSRRPMSKVADNRDGDDNISHRSSPLTMNAAAVAMLTDPHPCAHIVYPYTDEALVGQAVTVFASAGLRNGEGVVLILSSANYDAYILRLGRDGHDVEALKKSGRLVCLVAEDLLVAYMGEGGFEVERFETDVDEIIKACRATTVQGANGMVRGFGELVGIVWSVNLGTTVSLEQMWNRIIDRHKVSLMCTYELKGRKDIPDSVRALHSHSLNCAAVR